MNNVKYEYLCSKGVMWRFAQMYVHIHMYDDLDNGGDLNGVLKCTLNYIGRYICYVHVKEHLIWLRLMNSYKRPMMLACEDSIS